MVAIDESDCSHYALMWVLENLKDTITKSPLIIFVAQPPATGNITFAASLGVARISGICESAQENHRKFAVALLEKAKQICASHGVEAKVVTEIGDPKTADIAILGSVSNYCVQNAKCPVLVVKKAQFKLLDMIQISGYMDDSVSGERWQLNR
ncbi:universal stress protein YxiE-like [Prunus yedoensis var. nudiflora]|uniref:Universal stress protein YxiE-like n=1 Tax=Prunus yedoensis var. nudiflora TaxID=2094558 RepID=A0A314Y8N0_PRUYE|nr:universal stress protein YxiE-like [Prunus yedoensis var. nudiflora]